MKPYRSELFNKGHDRRAFHCGVARIDNYFHQRAGQDSRRSATAVHVLVETSSGETVGFYTLTNALVQLAQLPPDAAKKLPPYDSLGAVLIGWLGVDKRHQGKGIGTLLLHDAFTRCLEVAMISAWTAIVVDPVDDAARAFYEHHDFSPLLDDAKGRMYILSATIPKLLRDAVIGHGLEKVLHSKPGAEG